MSFFQRIISVNFADDKFFIDVINLSDLRFLLIITVNDSITRQVPSGARE